MAEESEEGFVFRDRRRAAEPTPAPQPETPPASEELVDPSELDASMMYDESMMESDDPAMAGALPDVYSVLALFLQELRSLAWLRMGLVANPSTGQIERDLDQARIAIDTVAFLASQLEAAVSPEERLPLKALVSDLQINFVEQSKK